MRDDACVRFLQEMLPRLGLQWPGYRRVHGTVCKRIRRRLQALGVKDLHAYRSLVLADPLERAELDALCRIPISRFGRDRMVFEALLARVLPELAEGRSEVACWSCGCASGEEPYALQILWRLRGPSVAPLRIVATDADPHMLERAKAGCYRRGSLKELPKEGVERAFAPSGDLLCIRPEFRAGIDFRRQDVRTEAPEGRFDLILCRNLAFTYFEPGLQLEVQGRLRAKLRPGGVLVLGRRERLPEDVPGLEPFAPELPIYVMQEKFPHSPGWQRGQ